MFLEWSFIPKGHSFTLGTTRYIRRSRLGGRARDRLRLGARDRARDLIG